MAQQISVTMVSLRVRSGFGRVQKLESGKPCRVLGLRFRLNLRSYYSFMHTLPHAHLVHWVCVFAPMGEKEVGMEGFQQKGCLLKSRTV